MNTTKESAQYRLYHGDCLEVMKGIEAGGVDLIVTDPPYFKVKGEWWDNQWDTRQGFISWIGELCQEWKRILAPNGSLYVFASPQMSAHAEVKVGEVFNVLNNVIWRKHDGSGYDTGGHSKVCRESLRSYFPRTESIIFAENYNSDNIALGESGYDSKCDKLRASVFSPLQKYMNDCRIKDGVSIGEIDKFTNTFMGSHWFTHPTQWGLPTKDSYKRLQVIVPSLRKEYEELRKEYEELRRPFFATKERPYTDVWDFPTVSNYSGKHPCEKPISMIDHIVKTSSREGDTVLDCFMGSGVTGVSCARLGREFVGIELDSQYYKSAERKVVAAYGGDVWAQPKNQVEIKNKHMKTLPLFELDTVAV